MKRFGNAYTGNTGASGLTERARFRAASRQVGQPLNALSDMSAINVVAGQIFCCPPVSVPEPPPVPPTPPPPEVPFWVRRGIPATPTWCVTDVSDRAVVCGYVDGSECEFYDTSGVLQGSLTISFGTRMGFVTVWNSDGSLAWAAKIDGGIIWPRQIVTDASGNVTVRGTFEDTVRIYDAASVLGETRTTGTQFSLFVAQWSATGDFNWLATVQATPTGGSRPPSLVMSDMALYGNDPICYGYMYSDSAASVDLTDGSGVVTSRSNNPFNTLGFLFRLTQAGDYVFMSTMYGVGGRILTATTLFTCTMSVTSDIFISGFAGFESFLNFTDDTGTPVISLSPGSITDNYSYVAAYDINGTPKWAFDVTGADNAVSSYSFVPDFQYVRAVDRNDPSPTSSTGYVVGSFAGPSTITFNDGITNPTLTTTEARAVYLAAVTLNDPMSAAGQCLWVTKADGSGTDEILACHADVTGGVVYVAILQRSPILTLYAPPGVAIAGTSTLPGGDTMGILLAAYDGAGLRWKRLIGGINHSGVVPYQIRLTQDTLPSAPRLFVTSTFRGGTARFYDADDVTVLKTLTSQGDRDSFVAQYDVFGAFRWASQVAGSGVDSGVWGSSAADGEFYGLTAYASDPVKVIDAAGTTRYTLAGAAGDMCLAVTRWPADGGS